MGNIELLQRQHQEIEDIIKNLEQLMAAKDIKEKSFDISLNIAKLAGKLLIHLNSEDNYLYPSLMQHTDPQIKRISRKFSEEMGNLVYTFSNYKKVYMLAQNIKNNPTDFLNQSQEILSVIKRRLTAEENELYPLLQ